MHELFLWSLPLLGPPLWAARQWMARRRVKPGTAPGIAIGQRLESPGTFPVAQGGQVNLGTLDARALVVVFMSNRCPGVKAYDDRLRQMATRFEPLGVRFVGVNSAPQALYPREGLAGMQRAATDRRIPFPYVKDASQVLMGRLGAACTPQVFVFDDGLRLRYRGRIDDSFIEARVRTHDLRDALHDVLAGRPVAVAETPALGCAIDIAPHGRNTPLVPSAVPA